MIAKITLGDRDPIDRVDILKAIILKLIHITRTGVNLSHTEHFIDVHSCTNKNKFKQTLHNITNSSVMAMGMGSFV